MQELEKTRIEIPEELTKKWQNIVDIMADLLEVPAALIMRVKPPHMEVFQASSNSANPYSPGDMEKMDGLYCEHVIKTNRKLLVADALADEAWAENPDIELGMIAYLGFPITWPDGEPFGTICILDERENSFSRETELLLGQFKELIESHLYIIIQSSRLEERVKELSCLYQLSRLAAEPDLSIADMFIKTVELLPAHFLAPERAEARIEFKEKEYQTGSYPAGERSLQKSFQTSGGETGLVEVAYRPAEEGREHTKFLPEEEEMLQAAAAQLGLMVDKKQAVESLYENREKLNTTLHSIGEGVITTDPAGYINKMNRAAQKLTGWTMPEAEGRALNKVFRIVNAHTGMPVQDPVTRALATGRIVGLANDTTLIAKDGDEHQIADSAAPVRDEDGEIMGVILVFSDVTEEYEYKEELRRSRQLIDVTLNSLSANICVLDRDGNIIKTNDSWQKFAAANGADHRQISASFNYIDVCTSAQGAGSAAAGRFARGIKEVMAGQRDYFALEYPCHSPTEQRWFIGRVTPYLDGDSERPGGAVIAHENITERKLAELELEENRKKYQQLAESANAILWEYDITRDSWEYVAPQSERILGFAPEEWTGLQFWQEHIHPEDRDWAINYCFACSARGENHVFEYRFLTKAGEVVWLKDEVSVEMGQDGPVKLRGLMIDITKLKQAQRQLSEKNEWLQALFTSNLDSIVIFDEQHNVLDVNAKFEETFKFSLEEIQGRNVDEIMDVYQDDVANREVTARLLQGHQIETEATRYDKYGQALEFLIRGIPVIVDGEVIGGYGIYIDITERKIKEEKIRHMSFHDGLTGLYNRSYLEEELERLDAERHLPISLVMIDLNGLKIINDSYGHEKGDELLIKTADIFRSTFRSSDIIGRWGGDEFVILLPETTEAEAEMIYERIKVQDLKINGFDFEDIPISLAVGIGVKTEPEEDIDSLFQRAENRMYKDKLLRNESAKSRTVKTLLKTLQEKSQETEAHARRMNELATALGEKIGLSHAEQDRLALLAALHDIGKTIIPESILSKPGSLTPEEWETISKHPGTGYRICSATEEFSHIANDILSHHEHWDGRGYPRGIGGEDIPLLARILTIADSYDVMTNGRPYKEPMSRQEALAEIRCCAGTQFDPELAEKFVEIIEQNNF